MARKLTLKQAKFVKEYVKSGNGTQSALKAYNIKTANTASVVAVETLAIPKVRDAIEQSFNAAGLTVQKIGNRLRKWVDSESHDASLRAISLWGDFVGVKIHKIEAEVNHNHVHKTTKFMQAFEVDEVIDVSGDAT